MIRFWPPCWKAEMAIDFSPPGASVPIDGPVELTVRLCGQEFTNLTWPASWPAHKEGKERTTRPTPRSGIGIFPLATRFLKPAAALLIVSSLIYGRLLTALGGLEPCRSPPFARNRSNAKHVASLP